MKNLLFLLIAMLALAACKQQKPANTNFHVLAASGTDAVAPYLTWDNKGNAVLCWTEKNSGDSLNVLKYAAYNTETRAFNGLVTVTVSRGMSTTAESMGKIAFKNDGTVLAVFAKRFTHEKNPFAGAIYYSASKDQGKSWTAAKFLHSDTAHNYGRSFFDIARLKNGQIAAVWLDGRYGKSIKGSALFFARTEPGKGFSADTCLHKGTCECCRTDLLRDAEGNLHLAYRSILFPNELMGKQVRDMVYQFSVDNGKTFTAPKPISKDNWAIEGCPHSGPTLAVNKSNVNAVWFTAAGAPGLYRTSSTADGFKPRSLITASGRHPQMTALPDGTLAMVCEEMMESEPAEQPMKMDHAHGGSMKMSHGPAVPAKIVLRLLRAGNQVKTIEISNGHESDHHAVITTVKDGIVVAWIREEDGHSSVCYSAMDYKDLQG